MPSAPSLPRSFSQIIVCGQRVPVDWDQVYTFADLPEFDASQLHCYRDRQDQPTTQALPFQPAEGVGRSPRRFAPRSLMHGSSDLRRLQQIIRQFVVHHDGLSGARECFHVLHDERGLSVHFIIDNDGTIYQTLDLVQGAYHATGVNASSIGVEICNRGKVLPGEERYYRDRSQADVKIHGDEYRMWQFTELQYQAMIALGRSLLRLFPNLPLTFPEDSRGQPIPTAIRDPREFSGYLGHYHATHAKWDPGCFDFRRVVGEIGGKPTWFVMPGAGSTAIADNPTLAQAQSQTILQNNHDEAMGGYFPVGPCGEAYVWHGGMHLSQSEGTPVYCPFPGRIAAARYGYMTATGSSDFVLIEHRLTVHGKAVQFYLLLFHLDFTPAPPWLKRARRRDPEQLRAGEVIFPAVFVSGGEQLGSVGVAGPPSNLEGQVHVEIFAEKDLGAELQPDFFRALSPRATSPFCGEREILGPIGLRTRPMQPASSALREFFQRTPDSEALRKIAVQFQSEWLQSTSREAQLLRSPDFRALPAPLAVLRDQIRPTQWWTPEVARRIGLPEDGRVWHYHPVTFLAWLHGLMQADRANSPQASRAPAEAAQPPATDGYGSEFGYVDDEDRMSQDDTELQLEQIAEGWP